MKTAYYFFIFFFVLGVVTLLIWLNGNCNEEAYSEAPSCGVIDYAVAPITDTLAIKGKAIFNANCAACHSINRRRTGPAMISAVDMLKKHNVTLKDFVYGERSYKTVDNNPESQNCMLFPYLSDDDINNLTAYISYYKTTIP